MVAIIYEGKTDKEFFNDLLKNYNLPSSENDIQYVNFEGVDNIFSISNKKYNELEDEVKIDKIGKVLIVVDADNKYKNRKKDIKELIENLSLSIPIKYYIMCDEKKEGNLESFLLSVLDKEQKECIKNFRKCYKYELSDKWAYNTFYKQKKYPFDFNHPNFNMLKEKLKWLFNDE